MVKFLFAKEKARVRFPLHDMTSLITSKSKKRHLVSVPSKEVQSRSIIRWSKVTWRSKILLGWWSPKIIQLRCQLESQSRRKKKRDQENLQLSSRNNLRSRISRRSILCFSKGPSNYSPISTSIFEAARNHIKDQVTTPPLTITLTDKEDIRWDPCGL